MSVFSNRFDSQPEEIDSYVASVLALVGGRNPMRILSETTGRVGELVGRCAAEVLRRPEEPGKWSVVEVVQHMADAELVWAYRLRLVAAQNGAELTGYDQDRWATALGYRDAGLENALGQLRLLRDANLRLLRSLTPSQWLHVGRHAERGEESIEHMVGLYAGHDLVHLRQLERILGAS